MIIKDITGEFENQNGVKFSLFYDELNEKWIIMSDKEGYAHLKFNLLIDAEEAVNIIKKSV